MDEVEAFRVLLGPLIGERPYDLIANRSRRIKVAVTDLLRPLHLGERLTFFRAVEDGENAVEWLVVKIQPSGQLSLLEPEPWLEQLTADAEAMRETEAALALARCAIAVLRELANIARLTPVQFHNILFQPDAGQAQGLALGAVALPLGQLLLREPGGVDVVAPAIDVIARVTLMEQVTIRYLPILVGKSEAYVQLRSDSGGYLRKRMPLHWGTSPSMDRISRTLYSAAMKRRQLSAVVRETCNSQGKVVRLEWVETAPKE
jgi:hypothetical protein